MVKLGFLLKQISLDIFDLLMIIKAHGDRRLLLLVNPYLLPYLMAIELSHLNKRDHFKVQTSSLVAIILPHI